MAQIDLGGGFVPIVSIAVAGLVAVCLYQAVRLWWRYWRNTRAEREARMVRGEWSSPGGSPAERQRTKPGDRDANRGDAGRLPRGGARRDQDEPPSRRPRQWVMAVIAGVLVAAIYAYPADAQEGTDGEADLRSGDACPECGIMEDEPLSEDYLEELSPEYRAEYEAEIEKLAEYEKRYDELEEEYDRVSDAGLKAPPMSDKSIRLEDEAGLITDRQDALLKEAKPTVKRVYNLETDISREVLGRSLGGDDDPDDGVLDSEEPTTPSASQYASEAPENADGDSFDEGYSKAKPDGQVGTGGTPEEGDGSFLRPLVWVAGTILFLLLAVSLVLGGGWGAIKGALGIGGNGRVR